RELVDPIPPERAVLAGVVQRVDERVPHLARRREDASVISITEDTPGALPRTVEPARDPRRESVQATGESPLVAGLGEEVDVVRLDAVLDDAEGAARRRGKRSLDQCM